MKLPTADIIVLLVYLAGVVGFGCWFVRRSRTTEGFMAASRNLPGWAVGLSIFGTYLSSNTFIGYPGKAYGANWNPFVFSLALPIAAVIAVRFFVPFYRRTGHISAYHHLQQRFGTWARTVAMTCYLLTQVARMGSIMLGVALGLDALIGQNLTSWLGSAGLEGALGWDAHTLNLAAIIVSMGLLVTLYTLLGGIEAVIWTDVVQSVVLLGGAAVILVLLLVDMPGGPAQIFTVAGKQAKFSLGTLAPTLTETTFWVMLLYGLTMNLNNFGIDQSFVQRYHTARCDREAAKSVWLAAMLYIPVSAVFLFIGTSLFAYYGGWPTENLEPVREKVAAGKVADDGLVPGDAGYEKAFDEALDKLKPSDIGDKVLPHFLVNELPTGLAGVLIAAIFAAAMSSMDTSLNSSATIVLSDFYRRFLRPAAGERESMIVLYAGTLLFGALGTTVAVSLIGVESILDAWWTLSGIFAGGMLGLFLLGLISRTAGNVAAMLGVAAGVMVTAPIVLLLIAPEPWQLPLSPVDKLLIPVLGSATIVLVGVLVGHLGRPSRGFGESEKA